MYIVTTSEVRYSATGYVEMALEIVQKLASENETIPVQIVEGIFGWKWYWVDWKPQQMSLSSWMELDAEIRYMERVIMGRYGLDADYYWFTNPPYPHL